MGSRVSLLSISQPITGPPHLPFDIFLEVLSHLQTSLAENRKIILALARCCRALRDASQRILFGRMHYGYLDTTPDRLLRTLKVHSKFLRAIMGSPDRLALYVLSYSQHRLALDPQSRSAAKALFLKHITAHIYVWTLTEQALPLMANLKHFKFSPLIFRPSAPMILQRCTFQLESLVWTGNGSEEALYTSFLPTQRSLLHLNINSDSYSDRPALPDGLCASITSIACSLSNLARVSAARRIRALQVANSGEDIAHPLREDLMSGTGRAAFLAALERIQLLRLWALPRFHRITGGILLHNITLLQIRNWTIEQSDLSPQDMSLLGQFPNLRFLRLWNPYPSDIDVSVHHETAQCAFNHCPTLERVLVLATVATPLLVWRLSRRRDGGIEEELIFIDDYIDSVWSTFQV